MSEVGGPRRPRLLHLIDVLALRRSIVGVLAVVLLVDLGERMGERFLPIYLYALGGGALSVGLLNGLDNLLSALYSFPGGYLADRIGSKRSLIVFNLAAIIGFLIVVAFPSWQAVIGGAILFISWSAISAPAMLTLIARVLPQSKRTMGVSLHSLVRRVPMAIGPLLGGAFIAAWGEKQGVRLAFVVAAVMAALAIPIQQILIHEDHKPSATARGSGSLRSHPWSLVKAMPPSLRSLLVSDILIRFCEQIPYAFVVIWCMKTPAFVHPVTAPQFGLLTTIEMVTAVLIYIPVAYFADRAAKKPFVVATFVFFTLFPLVLFYCRSFWWLVPAFVLRGLKEFGEPTRKALILDLSAEEQRGAMFGSYYLVRDVIVSLAAFGGAFLWRIGPATNLAAAALFGVAGTAWFALRGRDQ